MNLPASVQSCLSKYASFGGRASRSEFWWFVVFSGFGTVTMAALETRFLGFGSFTSGNGHWAWTSNGGPLSAIFILAMIVPMLAVAVRRLHDVDKSGWWILIKLVPLIGALYLLFLLTQPSQARVNRFGPLPPDML